jgi:DNA-binding beta-propeller fold protein YncE
MIPIIVVYFTNPGVITGRFSRATNMSADKSIIENVLIVAGALWNDISLKFYIFDGDVLIRHHLPGMGEFLVGTFALGVFGLVLILFRHLGSPWWRYVLYGAFISMLPGAITYERYHSMRNLAFPIFFFLMIVPALSWLLGAPKNGNAEADATEQRGGPTGIFTIGVPDRYLRLGLLTALLLLTAVQAIQFQILYREVGTNDERQRVFNEAYPRIFDKALADGSRPIYLDDGGDPAYIHSFWNAAVQGVDRSNFVHLLDGQFPPMGGLVLSSEGSCADCDVIERDGTFTLYRNTRPDFRQTAVPNQSSVKLGSGPGQFHRPHGIAFTPDSNYYIADTGNLRVEELDSSGNYISQIGVPGSGVGQFQQPHGVAVDRSGDLFVTDSARHMLLRFRADGTFVKEWHGINIPFYGPRDLAFGPDGKLYIIDQGCTRVVRFDPATEEYSFWGTAGSGEGQFTQSTGIDVKGGFVFVTDAGNGRVEVFDMNGKFIREWPVPQWQRDEQTYPDIAFDESTRRVYVSSGKTNEILVFNTEGQLLDSIKPEPPYELNNPSSLAIVKGKPGNQLVVVNTGGDDPKIGNPSIAFLSIGKSKGAK